MYRDIEKYKAYQKQYAIDNKKKVSDRGKKWYRENPDKVKLKKERDRVTNKKLNDFLRKNNPSLLIWKRIKKKAHSRGLEFSIQAKDIKIPKKCPILDLELKMNKLKPKANSPSLDRIDNNKGYIKGNVKVISRHANFLKSNMTKKQIKKLYEYMCK